MQPIMDRLYACLTEIDLLIRRQRRAMATIDALENMKHLERARQHIRQAQIELVPIEGDALPPEPPPSGP